MPASKRSTSPASPRKIGSDLAKVDAYVNTAADYDEIPDMAERDPAEGVFQAAGVPRVGRPPLGDRTKTQVTLRLDPAVIEHFKAGGRGWQSRINDALADVVKRNPRVGQD